MRAKLSLAQAWLIGIGAFGAVTASFCLALSIAISGPPTASETASLQDASLTALRAAERVSLRAASSLCPHLPHAFNDTVMCESRREQLAQAVPARTPKPIRYAPKPEPAAAPEPPPVIVAVAPPPVEATPVVAHERARIDPPIEPPRLVRRPPRLTHAAALRASRAPAHHVVAAEARHRTAHVVAGRTTPHRARPAAPARVVHPTPIRRIDVAPQAPITPVVAHRAAHLSDTDHIAAALPTDDPPVNERILPDDEPAQDSNDDSAPPPEPDKRKL